MPDLSDDELDALVEEATVDAYGDDEQLDGFAVMIEDNLEVPFETTILGVTVTVQKVTQTESGIFGLCAGNQHHDPGRFGSRPVRFSHLLTTAIRPHTPRTPRLGASKPIRHKPVEAYMLFGSFADKATVNLCRDTHHEPA